MNNKIPIGKIILSLLLITTLFVSLQPAHVSAAKDQDKSDKTSKQPSKKTGGKKKTAQPSNPSPAGGGGASTFDSCSAALLKSGHDTLTCTRITEAGNCNTGKVFNPDQRCLTTLPKVVANTGTLRKGLQIVFGVAAGVALISLGIAAFNFATAATDFEKISRSKKAIVFALLGLAISLLAEAIVTTIIGKL